MGTGGCCGIDRGVSGATPRDTLDPTPHIFSDPRIFPDVASAPEPARVVYALADRALAAETAQEADAVDVKLRAALDALLAGTGSELAGVLAGVPSVSVARHVWRALDAAWRDATRAPASALEVTVFALPLAIVVGREGASEGGSLSGVVENAERLAAVLRDHGALSGNTTFALANALVAAETIDIARLPAMLAWCRLPEAHAAGAVLPPRALPPAPMELRTGVEAVHLRFIPGVAIARAGADLTADAGTGKWGVPLTRELTAQLATGGTSVLALPRAPRRPLPAVAEGRAAQRNIAAQIFASNAIRKFRGTVGEPSAVISAHRAHDAPGGGELRLSLSSPFDPRAAEGFRCPLFALDRVHDVVAMLEELLRDCRVTDVRKLDGVHVDRADGATAPLMFKPDAIPDAVKYRVQ